MYTIDGALAMVQEFAKVCSSLSQTLDRMTIANLQYSPIMKKASLKLSTPAWQDLNTDVARVFNNSPVLSPYIDRWNSIVMKINASDCIFYTSVDEMRVLFHEMEDYLEDMKQETQSTKNNEMKVFISHSSKDKEYCQELVNFLFSLGFKKEYIVCTSIPNCGPPVGKDIYEWLRLQFDGNLHVIYMLSEDFFKSVPSVSEMGAAWVTQKTYTSFILPGFSMKRAEGPVDKGKMGVDLNLDGFELSAQLKQFVQRLDVAISDPQLDIIAEHFIKAIKKSGKAYDFIEEQ